MNYYKCTIRILIIILFFIFPESCNKNKDNRYAYPQYMCRVYKTKADYFNYVNTWTISNNGPTAIELDSRAFSVIDGDTVFNYRWHLKDNYILGAVITQYDYFTNITYKEIIKYNETHDECFPNDSLYKRVIDDDPFTEFYVLNDVYFDSRDDYRIDSLNTIIEKGLLEKYFIRIK